VSVSETCVTVPARELSAGDWIAHEGYVVFAHSWRGQIQVCIGGSIRLFAPDEQVRVHLEDHGEEE
jgi:hypothetical protein